jgi:Transglutaminase-like superfamily
MSKFLPKRKLTTDELILIPEVFLNLLLARLKVSLFSSKKYLPFNTKEPPIFQTGKKTETAQIIAGVVNGLSARTPWQSTCLVKVLALHKLLIKRKITHTLHFGIKKNADTGFGAHAWLSVDKKIIVGEEDLQDFKEISQILV